MRSFSIDSMNIIETEESKIEERIEKEARESPILIDEGGEGLGIEVVTDMLISNHDTNPKKDQSFNVSPIYLEVPEIYSNIPDNKTMGGYPFGLGFYNTLKPYEINKVQ